MSDEQQEPKDGISREPRQIWVPMDPIVRALTGGVAADRTLMEELDAVFSGTTDDVR